MVFWLAALPVLSAEISQQISALYGSAYVSSGSQRMSEYLQGAYELQYERWTLSIEAREALKDGELDQAEASVAYAIADPWEDWSFSVNVKAKGNGDFGEWPGEAEKEVALRVTQVSLPLKPSLNVKYYQDRDQWQGEFRLRHKQRLNDQLEGVAEAEIGKRWRGERSGHEWFRAGVGLNWEFVENWVCAGSVGYVANNKGTRDSVLWWDIAVEARF